MQQLTMSCDCKAPRNGESSPEMLSDIERIKQKIEETDAKITRLLRCEQDYFRQLDGREAEEAKEETEDVLISAAQNLLEAKKRLERA